VGGELLGDADCQKRMICEAYKNRRELGELGRRARHAVDLADAYASLAPDMLANALDEFSDAKAKGEEEDVPATCEELFECSKSLLPLKARYDRIAR